MFLPWGLARAIYSGLASQLVRSTRGWLVLLGSGLYPPQRLYVYVDLFPSDLDASGTGSRLKDPLFASASPGCWRLTTPLTIDHDI